MSIANWLVVIFGAPVVLGVAWQIYRDIKKDRADQLRDAAVRARNATLLEERVRRLEGRPADDDD